MVVASSNVYCWPQTHGGLAQLARAPALHAGGHRFDSDILHFFNNKNILTSNFSCSKLYAFNLICYSRIIFINSYQTVESSLTYCDNVDFINIKTPSTIFIIVLIRLTDLFI